jgi:hypothetical protein
VNAFDPVNIKKKFEISQNFRSSFLTSQHSMICSTFFSHGNKVTLTLEYVSCIFTLVSVHLMITIQLSGAQSPFDLSACNVDLC